MRLNYLAMLSVVSIVSLSAGTFVKPPAVRAEPASASVSAASPSVAFVSADPQNPTQGIARIVTEDGQRYLELDDSFQTSDAPDLFVVIHRSEKPESYERGEYLNLGRLRRLSGTQRYPIANSINLADYGSVVIWCKEFNVTMGYANLKGGTGTAEVNPCAGAGNPCAAKPNPCAGVSNPCAGAGNPCAAKPNPGAGR